MVIFNDNESSSCYWKCILNKNFINVANMKMLSQIIPNTNLRIHLSTHTGETPYQCSQCKRGFSLNFNLKKHLRIHTGEKRYQCSQYEKTFSQNTNLKKTSKSTYWRKTLSMQPVCLVFFTLYRSGKTCDFTC